MAANLPTGLVSHTRKVQNLYKRIIRQLEAIYDSREVFRYRAVLMRQQFDENKSVTDMRVAKNLLEKAEKEFYPYSFYPLKKFPESPGGVAYGREVESPDWVLDYWHPLEKAQYPEYFARREQRKKEYVKLWEKQYGKSTAGHH